MVLNALVERLERRSKDDFKGRHFEASLILQAVSWYLRYPLSYRDIEELFLERGLEVDHSTLNRWVLACAPLIERRLRSFRRPHCGSIRVNETYIKVRGQWRYLYRAIDKHGTPVDFLLTAKRDLEATKRFFRKSSTSSRCSHPTGSALMQPVPIRRPSEIPGRPASWRARPCTTSPSTCSSGSRATISG
jgi:transposase, IS6 family